jgi:hypothetical protein
MSCEDVNRRIIIKRGQGKPTIPVSTDHRVGDWLTTDIYEGEMYQDTDTGIVYTRMGEDIVVSGSQIDVEVVYKAALIQTGTNAITVTELVNPNNYTITSNYNGVGDYSLFGFLGEDFKSTIATNTYEVTLSTQELGYGEAAITSMSSDIEIDINTYDNTGTAANDILDNKWNVITVKKY